MSLPPTTVATVPFVADLRRHGDRRAVVCEREVLTYAELADRVEAFAGRLGAVRRLVAISGGNEVATVVAYLGALAGGHPVLMLPPSGPDQPGSAANAAALVAAYDPDVVVRDGRVEERHPGSTHDLHPDLALLLSTSGSTGSPKLVRLGAAGVQANAEAIATYLAIRDSDLAALNLPLHYCYGLSVLHSHLLAGAGVLLSDLSVVDPCFWAACREHGATSLAGVPHTFELLDRVGFADLDLPSLRYLTQAGGRMAPETVRRYAELGRRRGWDLVVMYGQTEATARMAYLPPDLAHDHPDAVGIAVPGGRFELAPAPGAAEGVGELVYAGPNVMLGYAADPADLARGREVERLHTGDLARIGEDGLVRIVGRSSRTAKLYGLRIDLDQLEAVLEDAGTPAFCCATDDRVVLAVDAAGDRPAVDAAVTLVRRRTGLPAAAVVGVVLDEVPRLPSGKPDRQGIAQLASRVVSTGSTSEGCSTSEGRGCSTSQGRGCRTSEGCSAHEVRRLYAELLGRPDAADDDTFVSLGGDSLSYVELSIRLESLLGHLPAGWHLQRIRDLEQAARPTGARRWWRLRTVETNVLLRAVAIFAIVASHANLLVLTGGAHLLLGVAGFNLARFHLTGALRRERCRRLLIGAVRVVVPAVLWIGAVTLLTGQYPWRTALLVNGLVGPPGWSEPAWHYWFVEALVAILLGVAALLALPMVDRLQRRQPFWFPAGLALAALLTRYDLVELRGGDDIHRAHVVLWLFAIGWAAAAATSARHRWVLSALLVATVPGFFGDLAREAFVVAGMLLLVWVPHLRVPAPAARLVGLLAGASLHVYLTHWQVYPHLEHELPWLATLLSLAVGVAAWQVCERLTNVVRRAGHAVRDARTQVRAASGGANSAWSPASSTGRDPGTTLTATRVPTG